jgi:hypothetical protein
MGTAFPGMFTLPVKIRDGGIHALSIIDFNDLR